MNRKTGAIHRPEGYSVECRWSFRTTIDVVACSPAEAERMAHLKIENGDASLPWNTSADDFNTEPDDMEVVPLTWSPDVADIDDYLGTIDREIHIWEIDADRRGPNYYEVNEIGANSEVIDYYVEPTLTLDEVLALFPKATFVIHAIHRTYTITPKEAK